jgi:hypothetical protein
MMVDENANAVIGSAIGHSTLTQLRIVKCIYLNEIDSSGFVHPTPTVFASLCVP